MIDAFVDSRGLVNYAALARSGQFEAHVKQAAMLVHADDAQLEQLGPEFWINLYNALIMHANVVVGNAKTPEERGTFFGTTAYQVGSITLTLDDIEHGVLRGSPEGDARSFPINDPRRKLAIPTDRVDPRLHFALNCGAKSCPPVKLFKAESLDQDLAAAAASFVASEVVVIEPDEEEGKVTVKLSMLFKWYGGDFSDNDAGLLAALGEFVPAESPTGRGIRRALEHGNFELEFEPYDWSLNDTK
mmetsp:Transcript_24421/g.66052  ORF Transcript_24421/g.66052 Transcript_24421/m.66052 type:complete len:245 (-) Transcript_24421:277-1011(-)